MQTDSVVVLQMTLSVLMERMSLLWQPVWPVEGWQR
jgi:hypothetical protein